MCGIFGYVGSNQAAPEVLEGLSRLAYRGYDSSGVAVADGQGSFAVRKAAGKLDNLLALIGDEQLEGRTAIGHTRWATHGEPTDVNAHPHLDGTGKIVVVHNGIVENYLELRQMLAAKGHVFTSSTDTEVIPHLIQENLARCSDTREAVRITGLQIRGAHAVACINSDFPDSIVIMRIGNAGGLTIGHGDNEMAFSSDLPALLSMTRNVSYLEPGEVATINRNGCSVTRLDGTAVRLKTYSVAASQEAAAKSGFKHFMLKEIMEQPNAAMDGIRGRLEFEPSNVLIQETQNLNDNFSAIARSVYVGVGTTLHACQIGARYTELLARLPSSAENASEFRYRDPVLSKEVLVTGVTQSGETADTLEALHVASHSDARILAITNAEGSQATRLAEATIPMRAGQEIAVASSKTFINSMLAMLFLSIRLGVDRNVIQGSTLTSLVNDIASLPSLLGETLQLNQRAYKRMAQKYGRASSILYVGRGLLEPIAREGALKLKEISYIHAEGMPAADMKHGPIALIDEKTPVVALALQNHLYEKTLSTMAEVRARGGKILAIASLGDSDVETLADDVLWVPSCPMILEPMVASIPVQLLAYHIADQLGHDVDQPRNLAKSVTVE